MRSNLLEADLLAVGGGGGTSGYRKKKRGVIGRGWGEAAVVSGAKEWGA